MWRRAPTGWILRRFALTEVPEAPFVRLRVPIVGVVGGIGSGKSQVAQLLAESGGTVRWMLPDWSPRIAPAGDTGGGDWSIGRWNPAERPEARHLPTVVVGERLAGLEVGHGVLAVPDRLGDAPPPNIPRLYWPNPHHRPAAWRCLRPNAPGPAVFRQCVPCGLLILCNPPKTLGIAARCGFFEVPAREWL